MSRLPSKHLFGLLALVHDERETIVLPELRRAVADVEDPKVQAALTEEVDRLNYHLGRLEAKTA